MHDDDYERVVYRRHWNTYDFTEVSLSPSLVFGLRWTDRGRWSLHLGPVEVHTDRH